MDGMTINHIVSIDHGSYGFIARKTGKVHLEKDDKAMISSDRGWYAGRRLPLHRAGGVAMDPKKQGHCWYFCQSICQVTIIFDKSWPSPATLSLFSTDHSCSRCLTHEQTQKWAWRHAKSFKQSPLSCRNGRSIRFSFEKKTHFFSNNPFLIEKTRFFSISGRRLWAEWLVLDIQGVLDERRWWTSMGFEGFPKLSDLVICGWCCCFGLMVIQFYIGH